MSEGTSGGDGRSGVSSRLATDPDGPTGRLATWVAQTRLDDIPASVRDHAKHPILDGIACALVGAQLQVSRKGVQNVTALEGTGTAELIGWGGRSTNPTSAAMLDSSFIQGFEQYRQLTDSVIDQDRQAAIEATVLHIEALEDISSLADLLTPMVRPALA